MRCIIVGANGSLYWPPVIAERITINAGYRARRTIVTPVAYLHAVVDGCQTNCNDQSNGPLASGYKTSLRIESEGEKEGSGGFDVAEHDRDLDVH